MGNQFAHVNSYSQKANKGGGSISSILGEATRQAEFSKHIDNPKPPREILGCMVDVQKAVDDIYQNQKLKVTIKGQVRERGVRKDRDVMLAGVLSFPSRTANFEGDSEERKYYDEWVELNLDYLREKYGENLKAVIEHTDEEWPHLHFYVVADAATDFNAKFLHDGHSAKLKAEATAKEKGLDARDAVHEGNKAFKSAMQTWQDEYYEKVGQPAGLTRLGPKRQRLSRAEYKAQKNDAREHSKLNLKEVKTENAIIAEKVRREASDYARRKRDDVQEANQRAQQKLKDAEEALRQARSDAEEIKLKATPEALKSLQTENTKLKKELQVWKDFVETVKATLKFLFPTDHENIRGHINSSWKSDPKNPDYKSPQNDWPNNSPR